MKLVDGRDWVCTECGAEGWLGDYGSMCFDASYFDDDEDEDSIPEGCAACGGDYPNCKSSCPLFDD